MMLSLYQFSMVKALAEHRHFGRAAVSLGVSQPSLTRSLKELEGRLGASLFDRHGVRPTVFGELVLRYGEPVIRNVAALMRELDLAKGLETGQLAISAGPYPADISARRAIGVLNAKYPGVSIEFMSSNWGTTVEHVLNGRVDVGFAEVSEAACHPDLDTDSVRQARLRFFCAARHPLAKRTNVTLHDLLEFPWVGPTVPGRIKAFIPKTPKPFGTFDEANDRFLPRVRIETFSDVKEIVLAGDGIGAALPVQLCREVSEGVCVFLPIDLPWMSLNYGFITQRGRSLSPAGKAFVDIIRRIERGLRLEEDAARDVS
jgi:DNA-binding transcriptional LysR family regulator